MSDQKLDLLLKNFDLLKNQVNDISVRLGNLESSANSAGASATTSQQATSTASANVGAPSSAGVTVTASSPASSAATLQREYETICASLQNVKINSELKLNDRSKAGIKRPDQGTSSIVSRSARYTETALKWLATMDPSTEPVSSEDLGHLFMILAAHINYLQSAYAKLVVQGAFDKDTAQLFSTLEQNSGLFTDESIRNIRTAAEITAASRRQQQASAGFTYRADGGNRYPRGRARPASYPTNYPDVFQRYQAPRFSGPRFQTPMNQHQQDNP